MKHCITIWTCIARRLKRVCMCDLKSTSHTELYHLLNLHTGLRAGLRELLSDGVHERNRHLRRRSRQWSGTASCGRYCRERQQDSTGAPWGTILYNADLLVGGRCSIQACQWLALAVPR